MKGIQMRNQAGLASLLAAIAFVAGCDKISGVQKFEYGYITRSSIDSKTFCIAQLGDQRLEDDQLAKWCGAKRDPFIAVNAAQFAGREGWEVFQVEPWHRESDSAYAETFHMRRELH